MKSHPPLVCQALFEFETLWVSLMNSTAAKLLWREMTGERPKSFSNIRWFSKLWMLDQLHENWSRLLAFVERLKQGHMAEKTTTKIDAMLQDPVATRELRLGLAATMDVLKPLGLETCKWVPTRGRVVRMFRRSSPLVLFVTRGVGRCACLFHRQSRG